MTVFEEDGFGRADDFGEDMTETGFARERKADRTYLSKTFHIDRETSSDFRQPARIIHKVFDCYRVALRRRGVDRLRIRGGKGSAEVARGARARSRQGALGTESAFSRCSGQDEDHPQPA